nr:protein kinase [Nannocystis pusilla]
MSLATAPTIPARASTTRSSPSWRRRSGASTRSSASSGAAGWASCCSRATSGSSGRSRSRCCRERAADAAHRQRFLREAKTAAKLSHPNIVPILHADEAARRLLHDAVRRRRDARRARAESRPGLRARWCGCSARSRGRWPTRTRAASCTATSSRRTSSSSARARVLVTDFGIAFEAQASRLTGDDQMVGTATYMSPEQILGRELDGRSDLYSLGVVGFWLLAGQHLRGRGDADGARQARDRQPRRCTLALEVPADLAAVIDRCLAKARRALGLRRGARRGAGRRRGRARLTARAHRRRPLLGERDVSAVLQRAAQLQADAARRVEERSRTAAAPAPTTASALRVSEVQAAAAEAGIAPSSWRWPPPSCPPAARSRSRRSRRPRRAAGRCACSARTSARITASRVIRAPAKAVPTPSDRRQTSPYSLRCRTPFARTRSTAASRRSACRSSSTPPTAAATADVPITCTC